MWKMASAWLDFFSRGVLNSKIVKIPTLNSAINLKWFLLLVSVVYNAKANRMRVEWILNRRQQGLFHVSTNLVKREGRTTKMMNQITVKNWAQHTAPTMEIEKCIHLTELWDGFLLWGHIHAPTKKHDMDYYTKKRAHTEWVILETCPVQSQVFTL